MKQLFTLVAAFAAIAPAGWAASICAPGTLATYVALGSSGCNIGTDTFSNFQMLSGITGALAIAPANISLTPSGDSATPLLTFNTTAQTSAILEAIFTYRLSGASFTGSTIALSNTSASGGGVVTHIQNLCGAGTFGIDGVSNCTGTTFGPLVAVSSGSDQTTFAGVPFLNITDDFTLDGASGGSASGGTFADRFTAVAAPSAVPEPGTILITSLGAALLVTLKLRSANQKAPSAIQEIL